MDNRKKKQFSFENIGASMFAWAQDLFPYNRSLTGKGVRKTLGYLQELIPGLLIHEVPTGLKAFDWTVPDEWTIFDAYIDDEFGNRIVDFKVNNLHLVSYSEPVNCWMSKEKLEKHLHSLPEQPNAIPYVTSYFNKTWGFCISHEQRQNLKSGMYHVVVESELSPGFLNYAELILPGETDKEVFLSTYICHPSMANNELSGPVVTTALIQWLLSLEKRFFTYRIVFVPETIGSITYLSRNLNVLKNNVIAGFNVTCVGDDRCYSFLPTRAGNHLSDIVAIHVLKHTDKNFRKYTWLDRGSDERQYCAPGIDLPIATIMRSKYGEYPEYHTSLDNLNLVSVTGLEGGFTALKRAIEIIENNVLVNSTILGEPQLGKWGLYPSISTKHSWEQAAILLNIITYCDGSRSLLEIANIIDKPFWSLKVEVDKLIDYGILKVVSLPVARTLER